VDLSEWHNRDSAPDSAYPAEKRPLLRAMMRGAAGACPACGVSPLFRRLVDVNGNCAACATELHHHRADDLPAYLNIFLVGHIVVGGMMTIMLLDLFSLWTMTAITVALAVASAVALMRPLKGMVIGAQWAMRMHGFGSEE
jgi:uncharacterized protein (DUF983 family)